MTIFQMSANLVFISSFKAESKRVSLADTKLAIKQEKILFTSPAKWSC